MFEDSLLESANRFRTHRGKTTALSFALECLVLGAVVLLPLLYTDALPHMQVLGVTPAVPPPAPPRGTRHLAQRRLPVISQLSDGRLLMPIAVPPHALTIQDPPAPDGPSGVPWGVEHSTGPIESDSTLKWVLTSHSATAPSAPRVERIVAKSEFTEGHLVRRVDPEYPTPARQNRIEGDVVLRAVIGRDGTLENVAVLSGHPFLTRAAMDAVAQWRYQPFLLNGRPIEVETQIVVRFRFSGN